MQTLSDVDPEKSVNMAQSRKMGLSRASREASLNFMSMKKNNLSASIDFNQEG